MQTCIKMTCKKEEKTVKLEIRVEEKITETVKARDNTKTH